MDSRMGIALGLMCGFAALYATTGMKGFAALAILCFVWLMSRVMIAGEPQHRGS